MPPSEFANTIRALRLIGLLALGLFWLSISAIAQSIDITTPSPVTSSEVTGQIDPRDLGDARLTDHFFAFTGIPGDLLITIEGRNLNGDVDVFNASGLRPLMKFSLYAETFAPVTKSIYLRKREDLIIRVEARTPNDDPGTYRVRFGGAFEPITSGPIFEAAEAARARAAENETALTPAKGRRVTSAGARIDEPPEEVAAAPTPEPEPTPIETPEPTPSETATTTPAEVTKPAPAEPRVAGAVQVAERGLAHLRQLNSPRRPTLPALKPNPQPILKLRPKRNPSPRRVQPEEVERDVVEPIRRPRRSPLKKVGRVC